MRTPMTRRFTHAALTLVLLSGPAFAAPDIYVAYPAPGASVAFERVILEGSVTPGATLTVSGKPVPVGPDGLFMEWWPLRPGTNDLKLVATLNGQRTVSVHRVIRKVQWPLPVTPTRIDPASVQPSIDVSFWDSANDPESERRITVAFRGSPGGTAMARLNGVAVIPMREVSTGNYQGVYTLPAGATLPATNFTVQLIGRDGQMATAQSPGQLSSAGERRVGAQRTGMVQGLGLNEATWVATDSQGQPVLYPRTGMLFPLVGQIGPDYRVRLPTGTSILIGASQLDTQPGSPPTAMGGTITLGESEGGTVTPPFEVPAVPSGPSWAPGGSQGASGSEAAPTAVSLVVSAPTSRSPISGTPRPRPSAQAVLELTVRIPLGGVKLPFTLTQTDGGRRLDLMLYGAFNRDLEAPSTRDPLLEQVTITKLAPGVTRVTLVLAESQAWGFHANYEGADLRVVVRRPPALNPVRPLTGRSITLDPGHGGAQPGGAGSLRVPEKDLVLPIALRVAAILRAQGATVYLTRDTDTTLGLYERGLVAESTRSDVIVSIHANALPDGRDPRGVRGPEVHYTHPQAQALSGLILNRLRQGLPELGAGRGLIPGANLALTRPSTQISVLVETAYLTDPGNLRVLMTPEGRERMAQAIAAGIGDFYAAQTPPTR